MTDERLRDLERHAATGDLEARAKHLLERVRAGDLASERLRFAAFLGDPASRRALPDRVIPQSRAAWIEGLGSFDLETRTRAALAAGRLCLTSCSTSAPPYLDQCAASLAAAAGALEAGEPGCPHADQTHLPSWARWNPGHPENAVDQAMATLSVVLVVQRLRDVLIPWALE